MGGLEMFKAPKGLKWESGSVEVDDVKSNFLNMIILHVCL